MRLRKLDLIRYGKFTNYTIDFGELAEDKPDFHIIYGLNEAGKSTALSAYLDLLFGIKRNSVYGFKHKKGTMEIGASLTLDGHTVDLRRNRSIKNSLRDSNGDPIAAGVLERELAGIGRDSYTTMFSLDDDSLEQGGKSILSSEGHLGELLYSASSGVDGLSQRLEKLRTDADLFYIPRGQNHQLGELLNELSGLKDKRNAITDKAEHYAQLTSNLDEFQQHYDKAREERTSSMLRQETITSLLAAKPRFDELNALNANLSPLSSLPDVPDNWSQDLQQLEKDTNLANHEKETNKKNKTRLEKDLESITVDEVTLQAHDNFIELEEARSRHKQAMEKQPALRKELHSLENAISISLEKLEQPKDRDPSSLRFSVATIVSLEDQIEARLTLDTKLDIARTELEKANLALDSSREQLKAEVTNTGITETTLSSIPELELAIAPLEGNGLALQLSTATSAHGDARDDLERSLVRLRPWTGEVELLSTMTVPDPGTLTAVEASLGNAHQALTQSAGVTSRLQDEVTDLKVQLQSTGQTTGVFNDAERNSLRERRDKAWTNHRSQLDNATAQTFENLLKEDDRAQSARITQSEVIARLNQLTELLVRRESELAQAKEKHLQAEQECDSLAQEVRQRANNISPMLEEMPIPALISWLEKRENALDKAVKVSKLARGISSLESQLTRAEFTLRQKLESAGLKTDIDSGLTQLLELARTTIKRTQQLTSVKAGQADCQQQVVKRQQDLDDAETAIAQWTQTWQNLCANSWLGSYDPLPTPKAVRNIITEVNSLESLVRQRGKLTAELESLLQNQELIEERIASFGSRIQFSQEDYDADEYFEELRHRVKLAVEADSERKNKLKQLENLQTEDLSVEQKLAIYAETTGAMYSSLGVSTLNEVRNKLAEVKEKKQLETRAASESRLLLETLAVPTLDEARVRLDSFDGEQLKRELTTLKTNFKDLDERVVQLSADIRSAKSEINAINSQGDVALLEEQREVLELEIMEKSKHYIAQKLGIMATRKALNRYRDSHRSDMLQQASKAFATISCGAYTRLETLDTASEEKLIGITADGVSKDSGDMSKGTRFQLYLALRVAGYHEFVKTQPQLPFIADDIMETFDDERAGEAFRVFASMASVGQVIYLTHHEHLCEIARSVCPTVNIHELNDGS